MGCCSSPDPLNPMAEHFSPLMSEIITDGNSMNEISDFIWAIFTIFSCGSKTELSWSRAVSAARLGNKELFFFFGSRTATDDSVQQESGEALMDKRCPRFGVCRQQAPRDNQPPAICSRPILLKEVPPSLPFECNISDLVFTCSRR
ncbi:hypothetical protein CDAR_402371 [Caerostris darwini]|uniref:Uncharacterized protein n=1 Tax=Caerostris darwini TaxID=1538125 RepID=A0AAV4R294_9ARAC|nr:hypothetical protein CDAR_402371 [Caerostris darwini]